MRRVLLTCMVFLLCGFSIGSWLERRSGSSVEQREDHIFESQAELRREECVEDSLPSLKSRAQKNEALVGKGDSHERTRLPAAVHFMREALKLERELDEVYFRKEYGLRWIWDIPLEDPLRRSYDDLWKESSAYIGRAEYFFQEKIISAEILISSKPDYLEDLSLPEPSDDETEPKSLASKRHMIEIIYITIRLFEDQNLVFYQGRGGTGFGGISPEGDILQNYQLLEGVRPGWDPKGLQVVFALPRQGQMESLFDVLIDIPENWQRGKMYWTPLSRDDYKSRAEDWQRQLVAADEEQEDN